MKKLFCGFASVPDSPHTLPPPPARPQPIEYPTPTLTRRRTTTTTTNASAQPNSSSHSTAIDENQWHSGECWDSNRLCCFKWTVPIRYQNLSYLGHGAVGTVMKATDTKTGKFVAIKMTPRPQTEKLDYKRVFRELKFLMHLNHDDSEVVQLYNVFTPERTLKDFKTLYLVMNFVGETLKQRIDEMKRTEQRFTESSIQHIMNSILRAVKFIHSAKIIHRDLKPENIGISNEDDVVVFDFNISGFQSKNLKTGYVQTRWWRAPEVFINWEIYDEKVDIWSVGCIMAELLLHKPLFPGNDHAEQIELIISFTGKPKQEELEKLRDIDVRKFIKDMDEIPPFDLKLLFPDLSDDGISFLQSLLRFDPKKRPSAEDALNHPFLTSKRDAASEITKVPIQGLYYNHKYENDKWKELIWKQMQQFEEPPWAL